MTNEEIFSSNPGQAENVGYWTLAQMKVILRLMSLARADELRKAADAIEEVWDASKPRIKYTLRTMAYELEREARK